MIEPDLDERVALVTGSATGVGRELALGLAARGATVAIHYRTSEDTAGKVAARAREDHGVAAITVQGDVTDPESVDDLFAEIETELGSVDVLVNNVGPFAPTHWEAIDFETWNAVLEGNFNGTYLCSKRALDPMRDQKWGRIVNIGYASSEKGLVNTQNFPYFVAKTGVLMFTRMLAADTQEDGITVNAVSPYVVENSEVFPADLPRDQPAAFEDVLQGVLFFCEAGSGYVSGENIEIDAGWLPETV